MTDISITSGLKAGSAQQKEVDAHAKAAAKSASEKTAISQQIAVLEIKVLSNQATDADKAELAKLKDAQTALVGPDPTKTELVVTEGHEVANSVTQQEYVITSLEKTPAPVKNIGEVRFVEVDENDLVSYINATVHLNPWGRMRQCDEDLKNLMATIGRDFNNELGEWSGIAKQLAESTTE